MSYHQNAATLILLHQNNPAFIWKVHVTLLRYCATSDTDTDSARKKGIGRQ